MSEDHLSESIARGDSARIGRGPMFARRPPLVDHIKSGEECQTSATNLYARLSVGEIPARIGRRLCDVAHARRALASLRIGATGLVS
jgi:hypothetical protein